ncbi:hypothetical protein [Streptomyces hokutonensis]|uniref:hypothetical protein n=1 Tax=Streptomyces hokutonensis TaxID=1306990 RepID=UPI00037C4613|nr:hypothetical protein [Streptomyces hokutonensis]
MTFNPRQRAARNGLPGNLNATNHADQVNQLLGTPATQVIYPGLQVLAPNGATFSWTDSATLNDFDQPFVMSGTAVGRVTVPVLTQGAGSDLTVSLCPDAAGAPDLSAPLAQTVMPASTLTNLASPLGLSAGGPLVSVDSGTLLYTATGTGTWASPAGSPNGAPDASGIVTSGDYFILIGGYDITVSAATDDVTSTQFLGDGLLAAPTPQPSLPLACFRSACAVTASSIVVAGGQTAASTGLLSNTWATSWDPNTGTVGSWSAQTALPVALSHSGAATWPIDDGVDVVYVIGGSTDGFSSGAVSTVYYNTVNNGQLGSTWLTGPNLPQAEHFMFSAVINGWLVVTGGVLSNSTITGNTYYAKIHDDGSLSGWFTGPTLPTPVWTGIGANWALSTTDDALVVVGGTMDAASTTFSPNIQVLSVTADDGPGQWFLTNEATLSEQIYRASLFTEGDETGSLVRLFKNGTYVYYNFVPVPLVSVPLPATGLTNGATYHVALHQSPTQVPLVDYLQFGAGVGGLASTFEYRAVGSSGAWSADASRSVLISVYDNTPNGGQPLHLWQDPDSSKLAAASSTFVNDWYGRLVGYCEGILSPNDALNSNPTFVTGTSPWVATNCTLTQSNAQVHGGLTESGLITPNGTSATVYASSELIRVTPGQWYEAQGWLYSPPGWSNVSLSVNWFDGNQVYLDTSYSIVSLTAATWTQQVNSFQAPNGATYATLVPTEGGTPSTARTLFLSNLTLTDADPSVLASVAQMTYPDSEPWAPTGLTQLN